MAYEHIQKLLEEQGKSQNELAGLLNRTPAVVTNLFNGVRLLKANEIQKIADWLSVSPEQIMSDIGKPKQTPVVGEIGAGERFYPFDDHAIGDGLEMVDAPENCTDCVAVRIRGDSMKPFKNGWLVFYERYADGVPSNCLNELCVVKLVDESVMLKMVKSGSLPNHYHLVSFNEQYKPIPDQKLLWASKVKNIRPS